MKITRRQIRRIIREAMDPGTASRLADMICNGIEEGEDTAMQSLELYNSLAGTSLEITWSIYGQEELAVVGEGHTKAKLDIESMHEDPDERVRELEQFRDDMDAVKNPCLKLRIYSVGGLQLRVMDTDFENTRKRWKDEYGEDGIW